MNTATDNVQPGQQTSSTAKPLWAAVGILGVAVLAMGGTMIYQGRTPAPAAQVAAISPELAKPMNAASMARSSAGGTNAADDMIEKPSAQPAKPAPVPAKKVVRPTPQPTPSPAPSVAGVAPAPSPYPAPAAVVAAPICGNCGAIESVTPIERTTKADGPGIGAVGGGVLGAVLGNQVGNGNGKTVATIIGAIGGGFAGNEVDKRRKKETVYTPAYVLDGKEWPRGTPPSAGPETPGVLRITIDGERVTVVFKPAANTGRHYEVHVARLGFALSADITAGENNGRKLVHDFVVLGLTNEGLKAGAKELKLPAEATPPVANSRRAIAAWVTQAGQIEPIQAVGGWLQ